MNLNFLKRKKTFKKGGFHSNPDIFWQFSLTLGLLIAITFSVFSFVLFMRISSELNFDQENISGRSRAVNEMKLKETLEYYKGREQTYNAIIYSSYGPIDPSL